MFLFKTWLLSVYSQFSIKNFVAWWTYTYLPFKLSNSWTNTLLKPFIAEVAFSKKKLGFIITNKETEIQPVTLCTLRSREFETFIKGFEFQKVLRNVLPFYSFVLTTGIFIFVGTADFYECSGVGTRG